MTTMITTTAGAHNEGNNDQGERHVATGKATTATTIRVATVKTTAATTTMGSYDRDSGNHNRNDRDDDGG